MKRSTSDFDRPCGQPRNARASTRDAHPHPPLSSRVHAHPAPHRPPAVPRSSRFSALQQCPRSSTPHVLQERPRSSRTPTSSSSARVLPRHSALQQGPRSSLTPPSGSVRVRPTSTAHQQRPRSSRAALAAGRARVLPRLSVRRQCPFPSSPIPSCETSLGKRFQFLALGWVAEPLPSALNRLRCACVSGNGAGRGLDRGFR